ncbi:hypothetical protein AALP_AAs74016U000100 [Arabis alpina]|uniref:Uncharacterized protein n=1 Tax=Arabis alpina TaxID=50452 RepID=A0A087FY89_ARAAL|nr:hypothetical protein AALP_AAs74016U000100 [Arabis alpina]
MGSWRVVCSLCQEWRYLVEPSAHSFMLFTHGLQGSQALLPKLS